MSTMPGGIPLEPWQGQAGASGDRSAGAATGTGGPVEAARRGYPRCSWWPTIACPVTAGRSSPIRKATGRRWRARHR